MTSVRVTGVPLWVPHERLLDDGPWEREGDAWIGERSPREAADLSARLRNLGMGGRALVVEADPKLPRALVRAARTEEARRKRHTSPGFTRRAARIDDPGKRYLTPEKLALELGQRSGASTVIDACCGCGGNAIGFARAGASVTAIELDEERLELAGHNARVYGVHRRIRFVHGDALELLPQLEADLVFLDPPWGEPDRIATPTIPLLEELIAACGPTRRIWAKVPASFVGRAGADSEAWFGHASGDYRRVKFLLLSLRS